MFPKWERWHTPIITEDSERTMYLQENSTLLATRTTGRRYLFMSSIVTNYFYSFPVSCVFLYFRLNSDVLANFASRALCGKCNGDKNFLQVSYKVMNYCATITSY